MRVISIEGTDLFVGTEAEPLQVVRVELVAEPGDVGADVALVGEGAPDPTAGVSHRPLDSRCSRSASPRRSSRGRQVPVRAVWDRTTDDGPIAGEAGTTD